jgi:hypothetical protein
MAESVSGTASFTDGLGFEPKVIGYALNEKTQPGAMSPAIKGRDGVFFIALTHRDVVATTADPMALKAQASMQDMQTKNYIQQALTQALRRQSTIKINPENIF